MRKASVNMPIVVETDLNFWILPTNDIVRLQPRPPYYVDASQVRGVELMSKAKEDCYACVKIVGTEFRLSKKPWCYDYAVCRRRRYYHRHREKVRERYRNRRDYYSMDGGLI